MTPEDTTEIKQEAEQTSDTSATVFLEDEEDFATLYEESVRPFREHEIVNARKAFDTVSICSSMTS